VPSAFGPEIATVQTGNVAGQVQAEAQADALAFGLFVWGEDCAKLAVIET
jgi:hypothetical protein